MNLLSMPPKKEPPPPMIGDCYSNHKGELFRYTANGWQFLGYLRNRGVK